MTAFLLAFPPAEKDREKNNSEQQITFPSLPSLIYLNSVLRHSYDLISSYPASSLLSHYPSSSASLPFLHRDPCILL